MNAVVTKWEQAEIDRSEFEALHTPPERLIAAFDSAATLSFPPGM